MRRASSHPLLHVIILTYIKFQVNIHRGANFLLFDYSLTYSFGYSLEYSFMCHATLRQGYDIVADLHFH